MDTDKASWVRETAAWPGAEGTDRLWEKEWQQPACRRTLETSRGQILKHSSVSFKGRDVVFPWAPMGSRNGEKVRGGRGGLCHCSSPGYGIWQGQQGAQGFLALAGSEEAVPETGSPGMMGMGRLIRRSVWDMLSLRFIRFILVSLSLP